MKMLSREHDKKKKLTDASVRLYDIPCLFVGRIPLSFAFDSAAFLLMKCSVVLSTYIYNRIHIV